MRTTMIKDNNLNKSPDDKTPSSLQSRMERRMALYGDTSKWSRLDLSKFK